MTQWMYGKNVVKQILMDSDRAHRICLTQKDPEILALAEKRHVPVQIIDRKAMDRMTGTDRHQGAAAEVEPYRTYSLDEILNGMPKEKEGLLILLDELEDPHNLGAILRTADAVQADGVIFRKDRAVGLTPAAAKVSAGAIDTVKCACVTNLVRTLEDLKQKGWWIVGTDMHGQDYRTLDVHRNLVLVIGNEGKGISRLVKQNCDYVITLPMRGKIQSLNASVSAGILMYEISSRRFPV